MNTVLTIIVTVLIFGSLIALHELGHYLFARMFGVGIREYSIGMGPKLFQVKGKYNKFTLRALPIGGYVDMVGETNDDDGSSPEDEGKVPLNTKPIWQRMLIVLAGPFTNIVLGLLIMSVLVLFQPHLYGTTINYFGNIAISDDSMVYLSEKHEDFQKGDIIFAIDGNAVNANDKGLEGFVAANKGEKQILVLRKNHTDFVLPVARVDLKTAFKDVETMDKIKLTIIDGFACVAEDVAVYENVLENDAPTLKKTGILLQKNDILYSLNGVLCTDEAKLEEYANGYITADSAIVLKRFGNTEKPIVIKTADVSTLPLAASGRLMAGDEIKKVGSYNTHVYADMSYGIFNDGVKPVDITVVRDGKKQTVENVVFYKGSEKGVIYGEIDFVPLEAPKTFGTVLHNVVFQPLSMLKTTLDGLVKTFTGRYGIEALSGPVGIGGQIGDVLASDSALSYRVEMLATLFVMITLSLGVCNLLPLPVLDGGRLLLYTIEAIRRKPLNAKVEQIIMTSSMILVLLLMVFVMFKDVIGLIL